MTLTIPTSIVEASDYEPLANKRPSYRSNDVEVPQRELTDDMLRAISKAAEQVGEKGVYRVAEAILAAREGDLTKSVPRLTALPQMLTAFLRHNLRDGWIYQRGADGYLSPWLVTDVEYHESRQQGDKPYVTMSLVANGRGSGRFRGNGPSLGIKRSTVHFSGESVVRKRISDLLTAQRLYVETPDLREEYDRGLVHYREVMDGGFAEQFRFSGKPSSDEYWADNSERVGRKVIHDLSPWEISAPSEYAVSMLFSEDKGDVSTKARKRSEVNEEDPGVGPVPIHFDVNVFDLGSHDFFWVNALDLTRYVYDKTLRDKIVLPEDQRNLLDILTTNLSDFTGDVIEGKSTGNVVLAKGEPGVGKTLTAEVYSELIERPLYSIHSGNLGIDAETVRKNLETVFQRAKRWNAVLLLDEADVFVLERGDNISQNAIVAEFLRTLEYFDGLMFMTTNRANNIDDAILSRAAAIIDYKIPDIDGIREVWKVQAKQQGVTLPEDLLEALVHGFARIAPRDVKMLLRLALRVAKGNEVPLDVDIFARCAMFRGLHFSEGSRKDEV